tara:strand:- start:1518 stop:1676 length:159 start_codon:yes stop_codon:yes gene_type:complete
MITLEGTYYTVEEVSRYLRQSDKTTRRQIYKGKLKAMRVGNKYLIDRNQFKN